ncbi:hypothetical protein B0T22DRAFT_472802 [Podospora appendiculata]|uniref:FAD/NAD(P)-binding domain-containing protein n=1 Tax=Podospora appendiculata TaxID=314037 RepID=A0AAE0X042_9PEZI|nr:hypothetical protein B0T22DRAFT_472802 [Podospora appendiculata]
MASSNEGYPPRADLRKMVREQPPPFVAPGTVDPASMGGDEPTKQAVLVLEKLNAALAADDAVALAGCFLGGSASHAYWRDQLALTWHLRTFTGPGVIAASLLETKTLRGLDGGFKLEGTATFMPVSPVLQIISGDFVFKTTSPAASCGGKVLLVPVQDHDHTESESGASAVKWKIWTLSTWVESLDVHPEDESLLQAPGRLLASSPEPFETDVFIIGGGNAAVTLAARLKAMGVDSIMAERNAKAGDNWALRYEHMRFHVPAAFCDMPYMPYDAALSAAGRFLSRQDLAEQVSRYTAAFHLNMINSASITSTVYDPTTHCWTIKFKTPAGAREAVAKHLVQATGIGSSKPCLPAMADRDIYTGISLHSNDYGNAASLVSRGAKSVLVIGSANTAFDVIEDCHAAGLSTTIVARSPTLIVPVSYICDPRGMGVVTVAGTEIGDRILATGPTVVDAHLGGGLMAFLAAQEPARYAALAATGFPVIDCAHPDANIIHNLAERAGGHYVDVGGTALIADGSVRVKANVEPVGFTPTGLRFSDGSALDADAVVWCTGFADLDARRTVAETLGGQQPLEQASGGALLGPREVAERMDSTWGVDHEGEIRGMWKRQSRLENYWVAGGHAQHHRWHSRTLALQIKAALEGVLPEAYRGTPEL